MWGFGGRHYWERKDRGGRKVEGIVVAFSWMSSLDKHMKNYVDLYSSIAWNSLICHSQFLNLFFPDKAASLAQEIVNELVQELRVRPCPVVFASFSGGPKACMYKVIQIIEGKCGEQTNLDDYRLVRDCVSGHIFDSTPVDFVSEMGTRFLTHPSVLKRSNPPRLATWIASGISSGLDAVFLSKLESQRAEYWQTLYSTVSMGAPYLILCSNDDDLAPIHIINNFASKLTELGADVRLVKWNSSTHVGHLRNYPEEYSAAVTELLTKAATIYSRRIRQLEGEKMGSDGTHDEISDPFLNLRRAASAAAAKSNESFKRIALDLNDHFLLPSSVEYHEDREGRSVQDERKEQRYMPFSSPPKMTAHGVLGEFLFDSCVPKNVEDWDIKSSSRFASARRHSPFNPIKCIRRSRL